jgi:DNA-binding IclR family transcriptional regulator
MTGVRREPGRTVVSKVLGILRLLTVSNSPLSLAEIATGDGLPPTTALRLLAELTESGVVERTPGGKYQLGVGLWQMGKLSARARQFRHAARPVILRLSLSLNAGSDVALHLSDESIVVDMALSRGLGIPISAFERPVVARPLPLHASAGGKLLLATLPRDARERLLEGNLPRYTPRTITDADRVLAQIESVAALGVATSDGELRAGWLSVGTYIRHPDGRPIGSAVVAVPSTDGSDRLILEPLKEAVSIIESRLRSYPSF